MRRFFLLAASMMLFPALAWAENPSLTVTAKAIPAKAKIGDEIRLVVQVERPKKFTLRPPSEKANIQPFEIKKVERSSRVSGTQNRPRETFIVTLTTFELGDLKIPALPMPYLDASGKEGRALTEPVSVKIVSVGKKPSDKNDVRPIKGPVSTPLAGLRTMLLAFFAAALFAFLVWRIARVKTRTVIDPETLKPPHDRAMLELGRLEAKSFLDQNKVREFYSELSDILRRYLERRFGIEAFELTTPETLIRLKEKTEGSVVRSAEDLLSTSDLVKFAKHVPDKAKGRSLETALKNIVEMTKPAEEEKK